MKKVVTATKAGFGNLQEHVAQFFEVRAAITKLVQEGVLKLFNKRGEEIF